ncbi:MAG: cytochrome c oxidase subunit II [Rhodocyclaceae bacterium]|nr:cytochrome c oxidase subunit II [Rhodocyclaceae bacterium]
MTVQDVVWAIWLIGSALIAVAFLWIAAQAGKPAGDQAQRASVRKAHIMQAWAFGFLVLVTVAGSWATLHRFPIPAQQGPLDSQQVVDVVGRTWSWTLAPGTVKAGSEVEFRVTSADVNHGFGIYSPTGHIVAQTQAMPEYTNKLLYRFTEPGTYTIQCIEYCGLGHAPMNATLEVVAPEKG